MKNLLTTITLLLTTALAYASEISGIITDPSGEALIGVNVYLKDTYDGATTDIDGKFRFETFESGEQTLIASFVGFEPYEVTIDVSQNADLNIALKEEVNKLTGVVITAGSFEASDEKKSVVLKPLDIAMTAGATADIPGALNTLPGTTTNGETGRLFVRGGTANETQAFIDGILVHNFYTASPNNVPSRSRFSPFLFKGTFFSTGGYSAEYGQALSSVLSLNSTDIPVETRTDFSLMTVGLDAAHTQKWENGSIYGQAQYTNLDPYNNVINQAYDWEKGFNSANGTFMLRQRLNKNDMLKVYANLDRSGFIVNMPNASGSTDHIDMINDNLYLNTSYKSAIGESSTGYLGVSYGKNTEDLTYNYDTDVFDSQKGVHAKGYLTHDIANFSIKAGGEFIESDNQEEVQIADSSNFISEYTNNLTAGFIETDYYVTNSITLRGGLRYGHYSLFSKGALSPRLSMAIKTGEYSQVSAAFGTFHQLPVRDLLLRSDLVSFERANHYMVSYQAIKNGLTFRAETYYKDYNDLVKFDASEPFNPTVYNNDGHGYATGIDLFFRDSKTINNGDYWISYSFIDTKRDFIHYPGEYTTTFSARHNLSVVYKHFIPEIKTQIGASYSFNSGRPYNDPNYDNFNGGKTKYYSDLSFNFAYLFRPNIILYASATNLLGRDNVFRYEFETSPGEDGWYDSMAITQPAKRFLFVGLFITLTKDQSANNLENL